MGKVMGLASAQLGGTAEGRMISTIVKKFDIKQNRFGI
jgi:uncharacterized protein YqeY